MHDYDIASQRVSVGGIVTAWAVAFALFAVLLALSNFPHMKIADSADVGTTAVIDRANSTQHALLRQWPTITCGQISFRTPGCDLQ